VEVMAQTPDANHDWFTIEGGVDPTPGATGGGYGVRLPVDLDSPDAVRLAAMSDEALARTLSIEAREVAGDVPALLHAAPRLYDEFAEASCGALSRSGWRAAVARTVQSNDVFGGAALLTVGELMQCFLARVPAGAHESRVRAALEVVLQPEPIGAVMGSSRAAALVQLLRGARLAAQEPLSCFILAELARLASPPLGVAGLVQHGVLQTMIGASQAARDAIAQAAAPAAASTALFLAAAALAHRGTQRGSKHGCVLVHEDVSGRAVVVGEGWNRDVFERPASRPREECGAARSASARGRKRVLHAECHAVADAIRRCGEEAAFNGFGSCTAWIVELKDETAYDDAPPCSKCSALLRAVGVSRVRHSTRGGQLAELQMGAPARTELLRIDSVARPLGFACDDLGIECRRLAEEGAGLYPKGDGKSGRGEGGGGPSQALAASGAGSLPEPQHGKLPPPPPSSPPPPPPVPPDTGPAAPPRALLSELAGAAAGLRPTVTRVRAPDGSLRAERRGLDTGEWEGEDPGAPRRDASAAAKVARAISNPRFQAANLRWNRYYAYKDMRVDEEEAMERGAASEGEPGGLRPTLRWAQPVIEQVAEPEPLGPHPAMLAHFVLLGDDALVLQLLWRVDPA